MVDMEEKEGYKIVPCSVCGEDMYTDVDRDDEFPTCAYCVLYDEFGEYNEVN